MKVKAFKIYNQKGANGFIKLLLSNNSIHDIPYGPNQMESFVLASNMLMSPYEIEIDTNINRLKVSGKKSNVDQDNEVSTFLNNN